MPSKAGTDIIHLHSSSSQRLCFSRRVSVLEPITLKLLSRAGMMSVTPSSAQLAEFGRLSRFSIRAAQNGGSKEVRLATQPRNSRVSQKRRFSKLKKKEETTEKPIYDEAMFDTNSFCGVTEEIESQDPPEKLAAGLETQDPPEKLAPGYGSRGLVPEDWKYIQQNLHLTKLEKKKQFKIQQMENAQLNELRAQLRRQKIDLLSSTEQPPTDPSWTGRTQPLDRMQLVELERELSLKAAGKKTLGMNVCFSSIIITTASFRTMMYLAFLVKESALLFLGRKKIAMFAL